MEVLLDRDPQAALSVFFLESQNGQLGSGKKRYSTAVLDCITRSANATWWEWTAVSHPFFWGWYPDYVATVRDGLRLWYKGYAPNHAVPQKDEPEPVRKEKIRFKLLKAQARSYFEYGDVVSLTQLFSVAKGDEDILMVYNGTSSGLNAHLWCPWFALATIYNILRALEPGTYMGDIDIGEMFLNFILEARCSYLAGVDLTKYIEKLGGEPRTRLVRCGMGFIPPPIKPIKQ
jgi:hypothetical protein